MCVLTACFNIRHFIWKHSWWKCTSPNFIFSPTALFKHFGRPSGFAQLFGYKWSQNDDSTWRISYNNFKMISDTQIALVVITLFACIDFIKWTDTNGVFQVQCRRYINRKPSFKVLPQAYISECITLTYQIMPISSQFKFLIRPEIYWDSTESFFFGLKTQCNSNVKFWFIFK